MYDIDESGEKELLVGIRSNGGDERVVGVYCFDGVDAKNMFEDQTLAERSLLQIYENGTMYIYGSGGALMEMRVLSDGWRTYSDSDRTIYL